MIFVSQNREQFFNFKFITMNFKSFYLTMAATVVTGSLSAQTGSQDVIILDLSKATTDLSFDEVNGMWHDTYEDDATEIESQVFSIVHGAISDYNYWYGFTASNSTDNLFQANTLTFQFSNMAKGGILLNEDGTIKTNEFGAPVSGKDMPYLVGFPKSEIVFNDGKSYQVVGAYVGLNSYTYYSILYGDGYSRAFTEGDELTLTVHGVDSNDNEKTVDVKLASFENGCLNAASGWKYIDLSALGEVEEIYFTMSSTDSGQWGMNTPSYFCLDKLTVKASSGTSGVTAETLSEGSKITYDRNATTINIGNQDFAIVYDSDGRIVLSVSDAESFSVQDLPYGVYVVKTANARLKFAR